MNSDKTSKTFHSKMAGNSISKSLNFRIFTERRPRISGPQPPGEGYLPRHIAAFFQNACYFLLSWSLRPWAMSANAL